MNISTIHSIKLLTEFYKSHPDIKTAFSEDGRFMTVKYVHQGVDFNDERIRWARGLTIDTEEHVIALAGFEKFFNYHQLEGNEQYDKFFKEEFTGGLSGELMVTEKLDGTMVLVSYNQFLDDIIVGTSSGTNLSGNEHAKQAYNRLKDLMPKFINSLARTTPEFTFIFEYVSPRNKIVVDYDKERFVLIGITQNDTLEHWRPEIYLKESNGFTEENKPKIKTITLENLVEYCKETQDNIEGFVAINNYNRRVKFKTNQWFVLSKQFDLFDFKKGHRKHIERAVQAYLDDDFDDIFAFLSLNKRKADADALMKYVTQAIEAEVIIRKGVEELSRAIEANGIAKSMKDLHSSDRPLKHAITAKYKGKEIDLVKHYADFIEQEGKVND